MIDLYIFSSNSRKNIRLGVKARRWAVSIADSIDARRWNEARRMPVGARGLLCLKDDPSMPDHCGFTIPFLVDSPVDTNILETKIWPNETWRYPFSIQPLGPLDNWKRIKKAREEWTDFPAKFSIHGAQTFTPIRVSENFWGNILRCLGHQDLPQEVFEAGPPPNKVSKYTRFLDDF